MTDKIYKILSINPGSTSTKIAVYANENELFRGSVEHDVAELSRYKSMVDQFEMRMDAVTSRLVAAKFRQASAA